ncbi:MAG: hypothetical protein M1511_12835 [Deltaproteobacteria bacterium]|nr:hypothetical protein [Deltaproteobacteria bacterium]
MRVDKSAQDMDLSSIPAEFRENYKFLSELINCKEKNNTASKGLESMVEERLKALRGNLNRRQLKILTDYLSRIDDDDDALLTPPVPAELEASIRIRNRGTWLPWETEAIRKIEKWRADVRHITVLWNANDHASITPIVLNSSITRVNSNNKIKA